MLLSRRYQFLFVHIAKTGGTSVRNALQRYRWRDPYYLPQWIASKLSGSLEAQHNLSPACGHVVKHTCAINHR